MLVLGRKVDEAVRIRVMPSDVPEEGIDLVVHFLEFRGETIRLGFDAPRTVEIVRTELDERQPA